MKTIPIPQSSRRSPRLVSLARALPAVLALAALAVTTQSSAQVQLPSGPPYLQVSASNSGSVAIGDMNGDGNKDVVIGVIDSPSTLQVALGNGQGGFAAPRTFTSDTASTYPGNIVLGDLNGDGKLDVVVINQGSNGSQTISVLFGDGAGNLSSPVIYDLFANTYNGHQSIYSIALANVRGDGKLDIIVSTNGDGPTGFQNGAGYSTSKVLVLHNNGSGVFTIPTTPVWTARGFYAESAAANLAVADMDGDGKLDIIVTSSFGDFNGNDTRNVYTVIYGDGTGAFPTTAGGRFPRNDVGSPYAANYSACGLAIADVDGDGKPDVIVTSSDFWLSGGGVAVFPNTGSHTFGAGTSFRHPYRLGANPIAVADLNNDGSPDLIISGAGTGGDIFYFLNDGHGVFSVMNADTGVWSDTYEIPATFCYGMAVGDLTNSGPGTTDIVIATPGAHTLLLKNGPAAPATPPAQLFFTDALTGPSSPNLAAIPTGKYSYTAAGLQRTGVITNSITDRPMVTTALATYLTANFKAEISVKLADGDLLYFGVGQGDMDPNYNNEPNHAYYFRVHSGFQGNHSIQGDVRASSTSYLALTDERVFGNYTSGSTVTLRIMRFGNTVTMSVVGGASVTYTLSAYQSALGLTNSNTRVFFGNTIAGSVFSNLSISPISTLSLGDIVGGGDGSGNGTYNTGIDATTGNSVGTLFAHQNLPAAGTAFHVTGNPRINGVFVPNGTTQISSTGLTYAFPATSATSWDAIRNGVSTLETNQDLNPIYDTTGTIVSIGVGTHANAGITFDLLQIAAVYPGKRASSVTGNVGGKPSVIRCGTGDAIARVLIDGVVVYTKKVGLTPDVNTLFDIPIPAGARFLTLVATDGGNGNGCDKAYFANALLNFDAAAPTDTTPPVITAPANLTAEATSAAGAAVSFTATATDDVDGPVAVVASPASGSTFAIGTTPVGLAASDAAHNTATASFNVTVRDTTAPVVSVPASLTTEATSASGAAVSYATPTATDAVGVTSLTSSPASGSTFALGATTVTATAKDAAGNTGTGSFTVTVKDTTAPALTVPASQTLEATSAAGAVATFAASATDAVTASPTITYSAASGSTFPLGTTTVNVSAKDGANNTSSGSFTVTVQDTTPPVITSVPANITAEATSASGATVMYAAATATDAVGVSSITYSQNSGTTFALGTTTVTVTAKDAAGNSSTKAFTVTVRDTTAPAIASVTPSSATLWPPNHQMVAITVSAIASDAVGVASLKIIGVTSNEPDNGLGDGDTPNDIQITGNLTVNLRAERSGGGNGRTYTITVEARDAAGNASTKTCTVSVPKSQGGK